MTPVGMGSDYEYMSLVEMVSTLSHTSAHALVLRMPKRLPFVFIVMTYQTAVPVLMHGVPGYDAL